MQKIIIGTRKSLLAIAQANIITETITHAHPNISTELLTITTSGDKNLAPFTSDPSGFKAMFTLELEQALLTHKIDIAVHSLKDMPANINPNLPVITYSKRADPRDALVVSSERLNVIGSSSLRRRLQLERLYPHAKILPVRGNITTRLRKLDNHEYDALVLAKAGLERLGLNERIVRVFDPHELMPAPGQGVLACQGRLGEDYAYLECVNDEASMWCSIAERSFSRKLNAGCNVPVGAYAQISGSTLTLSGLYVHDGKFLTGQVSGQVYEAEALGEHLTEVLS